MKNNHPIWMTLVIAALLLSTTAVSTANTTSSDPLSYLGATETQGAAAGYVEDKTCRNCHQEKYDSYQSVGMAKSFVRPVNASKLERFGEEFYHSPSGRYYRIDLDGDRWVFYRYQKDAKGQTINHFQTDIDWVVGSGNRARVYFYQTDWGEMFQLPLGWYSEVQQWQMAPGYEDKGHPGIHRKVLRSCMFCHNALPEVASGSDQHHKPSQFPKHMPEGTGCQRCHGPGADHIRAVFAGKDLKTIHSRITNPRKLPVAERDSVCFQCHMLPAVSMTGVRRFDRSDYSFRPGELLSSYLVHIEVDELNRPKAQRFEINHHAYRLTQSQCFEQSQGDLTCISCHDPHVKPSSTTFRNKVTKVCQDCHQHPDQAHAEKTQWQQQNCANCHMPTRRTDDVIHVTMTDHRIARGPFDAKALIAPIERTDPIITELKVMPLTGAPEGPEAQIYRAISSLRGLATKPAANALKNLLIKHRYPALQPYLDLMKAQLNLGQIAELDNTARFVLRQVPDQPQVLTFLGQSQLKQNQIEAAINNLQKVIKLEPSPSAYFNLGMAHYQHTSYQSATKQFEQAIALRQNAYKSWYYLGMSQYKTKQLEAATQSFMRCLEFSPSYTPAYIQLISLLRHQGQTAMADRYLQAGLTSSSESEELKKLISN